ncbi:MAG: methylmalonyl-CoA epimerase [Chloroflexi bacterium]|nr:methylmalonyl-CoA epimerase [Chloroflexota bacterium]MBL7061791.1 methylmalonyl-CoA epimerase [Dehalococcoidia bacterium]
MIKKVHHVAIVVKNLDEALELYDNLFGTKPSKIETIQQQGVKAALLPMAEGGEIELLEPIDPQSSIAKFLESRGEGIHHICFEVENVDQELCTLADKGAQLIDKQGRLGLTGKVGFIHPKSTKGVLIELAQKV